METYATAILIAVPIFMVLIVAETLYGIIKGDRTHHAFDTISSLSSGVTNVIKDSLGLVIIIVGYPVLVSFLAIVSIEASWQLYLLGFVAVDFAGYWSHRLNHRVNFFWNNHVIHHSSEEFNLACALRQSISNVIGIYSLFLIPAAILGIPPEVISVIAPLHLFLQFWYHTRVIPKLGWLEYILITPSQHRVHHAINDEYLDKNLGQIFTWWDRMFGTYQEELDDVPPVYGVLRPVKTWNPIRINFQHIWMLAKDAWRTNSVIDKLRIWFMPTGWRPADVKEKYPVEKIEDVYHVEKYHTETTRGLSAWIWLQFMVTTGLLMDMLFRFGALSAFDLYLYGTFIFMSIYGYTSLMDRTQWAPYLESIRAIAGALWIWQSGGWFGLEDTTGFLVVALSFFFLVSIPGPWLVRVTRPGEGRAISTS